jgi:hypothetical protein
MTRKQPDGLYAQHRHEAVWLRTAAAADNVLPLAILGVLHFLTTPMKNQKQESNVVPLDPAQILTLSELAERLKVSERWVYEKSRRRCQNPLPTIRIGRYLRFDWLSVSSWLREQEQCGKRAA